MKIAVCVKHVPEGPSRLDPSTKRLDRSGEGALNHFDANAVEEALRLKGDSDTEVVAVSLGPQQALDSLRKALAMGADRAVLVSDDAARGLRPRRDEPAARGGAREGGRRPRPVRPAGLRRRRRRPLGGCRRAPRPAGRLAGDGARGRRRLRPREAADGVRLRHARGAAARGRRRERRDQRAALPVAQGDHGREEEAAGRPLARRARRRRRRGGRGRLAAPTVLALGDPPARGDARKIEDDGNAAQAIVDFLAEKRLV